MRDQSSRRSRQQSIDGLTLMPPPPIFILQRERERDEKIGSFLEEKWNQESKRKSGFSFLQPLFSSEPKKHALLSGRGGRRGHILRVFLRGERGRRRRGKNVLWKGGKKDESGFTPAFSHSCSFVRSFEGEPLSFSHIFLLPSFFYLPPTCPFMEPPPPPTKKGELCQLSQQEKKTKKIYTYFFCWESMRHKKNVLGNLH